MDQRAWLPSGGWSTPAAVRISTMVSGDLGMPRSSSSSSTLRISAAALGHTMNMPSAPNQTRERSVFGDQAACEKVAAAVAAFRVPA